MKLLVLLITTGLMPRSAVGQHIRFHHVLPLTTEYGVAKSTEKAQAINKAHQRLVAQRYPKVARNQDVRFVYRGLSGDRVAVPICTGQPGIWATVKLEGTVPVVDTWQFELPDLKTSSNVIRCYTDLKQHRIEIDLTRDSIGEPSQVAVIPFRAFLISSNTVPLRLRLTFRNGVNPTLATTNLSLAVNAGWGR